jgi:hypothetical protein
MLRLMSIAEGAQGIAQRIAGYLQQSRKRIDTSAHETLQNVIVSGAGPPIVVATRC